MIADSASRTLPAPSAGSGFPAEGQREGTATEVPTQSILCVDDEDNILNALRRLLRPYGWRVVTVNSPVRALDVLLEDSFDLIISDMRMPEMDGSKFLEQARSLQPDAIRILLTGQADMSSTVDAINRGGLYRFISKPWDDQQFVFEVRRALERRALELDRARLEAITHGQNQLLREMNQTLEERVRARTAEIDAANASLQLAQERLRSDFALSIKLLASLIELRERSLAGHSRRVAEIARQIAASLGLDRNGTQDLIYAALLHDIGKIGLRDDLLHTPEALIEGLDRAEIRKHPLKGEAALMGVSGLRGAAALVRSHRERYDGNGSPDGLVGEEIPLGARILSVAKDYDAVQLGTLTDECLSPGEALRFIEARVGTHYDPRVVAALCRALPQSGERTEAAAGGDEESVTVGAADVEIAPQDLRPGMTLSRDVISGEGFLLLAAEEKLSAELIAHLADYAGVEKEPVRFWVYSER